MPQPKANIIDAMDPTQLEPSLSTYRSNGNFEAAREVLNQPHAKLSWMTEGYVARFLAFTAVGGIVKAAENNDFDRATSLFTMWDNDPDTKSVERKNLFTIPSSALVSAIKHHNIDMVKLLFEKDVEFNGGVIAQIASADTGCDFENPQTLRILDELVRHGWDINALPSESPYRNRTYPILHAVENDSFLVWLISKGASTQVADHRGNGPLTLCARRGTLEGMRTLLAHGAKPDNNTIHWTISRRRKDDPDRLPMLALLVEHGADINALETEQPYATNGRATKILRTSPLHVAIEQRDLQTVEFLVDNGANVQNQQLARWPWEKEFVKSTSALDEMRVYHKFFGKFAEERWGEETAEEAERRKERSRAKSHVRKVGDAS